MHRAFNEATQSIGADTLINVFVDKQCWFPLIPIYIDCDLNLIGTAIKYVEKNGGQIQKYDVDYGDSYPTFSAPIKISGETGEKASGQEPTSPTKVPGIN